MSKPNKMAARGALSDKTARGAGATNTRDTSITNARDASTAAATISKPPILFLGNGSLAEAAVATLAKYFTIVFHAHTKADLEPMLKLKKERPELPAVLASFGVILRPEVLAPFEPQGIINIHPSLLPKYRGPAPIEAALLNGDTELGVSVMKITAEMDAGPIYYQERLEIGEDVPKAEVYQRLATAGAAWIGKNLYNAPALGGQDARGDQDARGGQNTLSGQGALSSQGARGDQGEKTLFALPVPQPQNDRKATFTRMLKKRDGVLHPAEKSALTLAREVRAYAGFPKSKFTFGPEFGNVTCTILRAHAATADAIDASAVVVTADGQLLLACADHSYLVIDELQPESRKAMSATAFINGYRR